MSNEKNKRPIIITIFAILVLLSIPGDIVKLVVFNKAKYQEDIKNDETLIKSGEVTYRNKTVYLEKQHDAQKNIIKSRLMRNKKIESIFFVFKFFKGMFVVLNIFLCYGLWNLRKWVYIPLMLGIGLGVLFNIILMFFNSILLLFLTTLSLAAIIYGVRKYGSYFVY